MLRILHLEDSDLDAKLVSTVLTRAGLECDITVVDSRDTFVRTLEKGEAPLDKSIEPYQEGDRLKRHCEARLKDAQARIEQIAFGSDGKPAGLKPFDAG